MFSMFDRWGFMEFKGMCWFSFVNPRVLILTGSCDCNLGTQNLSLIHRHTALEAKQRTVVSTLWFAANGISVRSLAR